MSKKRKQKSPVVALLIGAAVLGYFLLTKKGSTATDTGVTTDDGSGTTDAPPPTPPPVYSSGLSTDVINTILTHEQQTALTTAYNTIYSLPSTSWPGWSATEKVMAKLKDNGDLASLQAIAHYITEFLQVGKPLTRTSDNAALYDKIIQIHNTYGIF